jgi:hypothetical protein
MAFVTWLLMKMGMAPSLEDFQRMDREFRERGHHLTVDFGKQHVGWTRWSGDPNFQSLALVGLGYEYLVDRKYHGVGFEFQTESHGPVLRPSTGPNSFYLGSGLAYYPIRNVRLFMQGGSEIDMHGDSMAVGRFGAGFRFMFFKLGMQPYFYLQQTTTNQHGWAINFRFEY